MADAVQSEVSCHRHLLWFLAVGCTSAAVHWSTVLILVECARLQPLQANVLGWSVALLVSFCGHFRLTFRGHGTPVRTAALRFFMVSAMGFGVNEAAYAILLRWHSQHYGFWLAVVLVAVAGMTYGLSRHWAFLRTSANSP